MKLKENSLRRTKILNGLKLGVKVQVVWILQSWACLL